MIITASWMENTWFIEKSFFLVAGGDCEGLC
jgi:hypothetical protein